MVPPPGIVGKKKHFDGLSLHGPETPPPMSYHERRENMNGGLSKS